MVVYILMVHLDYEGSDYLGVFFEHEKAEAFYKEWRSENNYCDSYTIYSEEVQ